MKMKVWANDLREIVDLKDYGYTDELLGGMDPEDLQFLLDEVRKRVIVRKLKCGSYFIQGEPDGTENDN